MAAVEPPSPSATIPRKALSAKRLGLYFAVAGVTIGFFFMAYFLLSEKCNFFNFPTTEAPINTGNPTAQAFYRWSIDFMTILCPGLNLMIFTIDATAGVNYSLWVISALLNGPIYFCLGLLVAGALNVLRRLKGS
jgi:hypothetical protein